MAWPPWAVKGDKKKLKWWSEHHYTELKTRNTLRRSWSDSTAGLCSSLLWTCSSDFLTRHTSKAKSCAQNTCECCIPLACLSKIMEFFYKPSTPRRKMKIFVSWPMKCCVVNASNEIPHVHWRPNTWMIFILRLTSPIPSCSGINFFFFFNWGIDALGFPDGSVVKNLPARAGDACSIPGPGRSPGGGNGSPLQCSWWDNSQGQRSLAGYSPWDHKRVKHNLATKQ